MVALSEVIIITSQTDTKLMCSFLFYKKVVDNRLFRFVKDLFGSLLDGISKIAVTRGSHQLRVLFIRFKPLMLTTCDQAATWGSSQGAMFECVLKASCENIEYGLTKDRAPVDISGFHLHEMFFNC
ncbi:Armadillo-type fold [Artemisia annua]|uniref:Armadillo-type fold n=1 Tax=Artemisia annua TaxID=35608 RepID=A0A2U1MCQ0_ARTAN|nr:Armadillo-type fold [Artemisia annua]